MPELANATTESGMYGLFTLNTAMIRAIPNRNVNLLLKFFVSPMQLGCFFCNNPFLNLQPAEWLNNDFD